MNRRQQRSRQHRGPFSGCKLLGASPCSEHADEGEIDVNPLKGELGYINKSKDEVGVLLEPAEEKGRVRGVQLRIGLRSTRSSASGDAKEGAAYSPERRAATTDHLADHACQHDEPRLTQVYTINENEENIPSKFEGKHIDLLET